MMLGGTDMSFDGIAGGLGVRAGRNGFQSRRKSRAGLNDLSDHFGCCEEREEVRGVLVLNDKASNQHILTGGDLIEALL